MLQNSLLLELEQYVELRLQPVLYHVSEVSYNKMFSSEIENFINQKRTKSFSEVLFSYIDKKGCSDADIYKKAGIDRRHFSKIRSNPQYKIGKHPAIALALALQLTKRETEKLLSSAGFSLSDNDTFDLVIQFCLEKKIYDIDEVNEALHYFSLKPLLRISE